MTSEPANWHKAFETIGSACVRLQLETRRNEYPAEYTKEAYAWLREKEAEAAERSLLRWAIVAGAAAILGAIAAWIAAFPVIKEWNYLCPSP
jgi:hypothetical protein